MISNTIKQIIMVLLCLILLASCRDADAIQDNNQVLSSGDESQSSMPEESSSMPDFSVSVADVDVKLNNEQLIAAIVEWGEVGKVLDCDVVLGTAEDTSFILGDNGVADGCFIVYEEEYLTFHHTHGSLIGEARNFNPMLNQLHRSDIERYFGEYDYISETDIGELVLGYIINDDFRIKFVFATTEGDAYLHHYNLFMPEAYRNSMANNVPKEW